jgi:Zn ribbon nucleic-acid-binding protein
MPEIDETLTECPNCNAIWTMDEIDWQSCFACGYPNHDEDDNEAELNDFDYE